MPACGWSAPKEICQVTVYAEGKSGVRGDEEEKAGARGVTDRVQAAELRYNVIPWGRELAHEQLSFVAGGRQHKTTGVALVPVWMRSQCGRRGQSDELGDETIAEA